MENLNKDNIQTKQPINTPKKEGCFSKALTLIGFIIILSAIARTCFNQQNHKNTPQKDNVLIRHSDKEHKYSILYPSSWEILPDHLKNRFKELLPENSQLLIAIGGENGNLIMQVIKEKTDKNANVNTLYEQAVSNSPLMSTIVSKDTTNINGLNAIIAVNAYTTPDGKPAKTMSLFLLSNIYLWKVLIGGQPESFDANFAVIDSVVHSISFMN